jgi:PHD/YefM family antitoxin component YafN of YafNO toxin-antitoxin module
MIARSISEVRKNIKYYVDLAVENDEVIFVTRGNNKNVVLVSEKLFNYYQDELIKKTEDKNIGVK